jgi:hypothetical protein
MSMLFMVCSCVVFAWLVECGYSWTFDINNHGTCGTNIDKNQTFSAIRAGVELPCPLLSQAPMNADIPQLGYSPETPYALDLEVFTMAELRLRGDKQQVRTTHRYEFHTLVCVTRGTCTQVVDFRSVSCAAGSVLVLRPGQTHNFGPDEDWDGWIVPFRPEFVSPASAAPRDAKLVIDIWRLPEHVALTQDELQTISGAIAQMRGDTQLDGPHDDLHALLRHQLHAMLTRLGLLQARRHAQQLVNSPALQRFKRFQELVDEHFAQWHQVKEYASQLGYTEKSLAPRRSCIGGHDGQGLHRGADHSGGEASAGAHRPAGRHHWRPTGLRRAHELQQVLQARGAMYAGGVPAATKDFQLMEESRPHLFSSGPAAQA